MATKQYGRIESLLGAFGPQTKAALKTVLSESDAALLDELFEKLERAVDESKTKEERAVLRFGRLPEGALFYLADDDPEDCPLYLKYGSDPDNGNNAVYVGNSAFDPDEVVDEENTVDNSAKVVLAADEMRQTAVQMVTHTLTEYQREIEKIDTLLGFLTPG